ncbi:hypothetical protein DOY81_011184 [Sarcophaga bullata]|nr:hypothetical protein DOY81_011184 [Sarcophaga bullata]
MGQEDQEFLIQEHKKRTTASAPGTFEASAINSGFSKSYGSLASNESSSLYIFLGIMLDVFCGAPGENGYRILPAMVKIRLRERPNLIRKSMKRYRWYYKASWPTQFRAIMWRSWISTVKEPLLVKVRLIQTVMVAVLIGLIFLNQPMTQVGVMNINGAIFLFLTNMTFQNVFAVINVFTSEIPVFMRETRSRLYRCDTYFLGKTIAELPLFLVVPFLFTAIAYPMIGLRPGWDHFFHALALVTLVANVSTSFGYLISCASSSTSMALSVGPPVTIPFLLFGGFFLNSGSVPVYFKFVISLGSVMPMKAY